MSIPAGLQFSMVGGTLVRDYGPKITAGLEVPPEISE